MFGLFYRIVTLIYTDIHVSTENKITFEGKRILIKAHAIKRAREKDIAYPDQVFNVIKTGKVKRFGKNFIKFTKKTKSGSIICIGEDLGEIIIIKTIERKTKWNAHHVKRKWNL